MENEHTTSPEQTVEREAHEPTDATQSPENKPQVDPERAGHLGAICAFIIVLVITGIAALIASEDKTRGLLALAFCVILALIILPFGIKKFRE